MPRQGRVGGLCREEALMPAFYLEGPAEVGSVVPLPKDEAKHALRVLRMNVGDELCALDGCGGRYAAVLESASGDSSSSGGLKNGGNYEANG